MEIKTQTWIALLNDPWKLKEIKSCHYKNCINFVLECIPFDTSLQVVSGVRLTDTLLKRTYNFDDFCHVYVKPEVDVEGNDLDLISRAGWK